MRFLLLIAACCASAAIGLSQPLNPDPFQQQKDAVAANRRSSAAHFRLGEAYLLQRSFQSAANEFREALNRR
jgi:hypothetical protein